jgi:hypothetical protein
MATSVAQLKVERAKYSLQVLTAGEDSRSVVNDRESIWDNASPLSNVGAVSDLMASAVRHERPAAGSRAPPVPSSNDPVSAALASVIFELLHVRIRMLATSASVS